MAKSGYKLQPIETSPGVQPITDQTRVSTKNHVYADKIRWRNGKPQKIGGWMKQLFDYDEEIDGVVRSIFTEVINGKLYTVIGSNSKLYSLIGSRLTNITPLVTTPTAAANSLDTHYDTLTNNPFSVQNGSTTITISDSEAGFYNPGDTITISGATGFAGISSGSLNTQHLVRSVGIGVMSIIIGTAANATTTGGGASVIRSSGLLTLNSTAHGQLDGDRVKIANAATTGGISNTVINTEFIIRNVTVNSFDVMTTGTASSSVSAGGGASTAYYKELPDGNVNQGTFTGYGAGLYGAGLYGTSLVSTSGITYPRIWFCDRYGDTIVMTPGNQGSIYQWFGDNSVSPALISNAPTMVNYAFVASNILLTLGANDGNLVENRVFGSDQNAITVWTSSSTNQVFDDDIEGAGRLIAHLPVNDLNLIFTPYNTYTLRYIGLPFVWEIKPLDPVIGLIAPMAKVSAKGMGFWIGINNIYMYRGGSVEVVPANTQEQCTALNYVFKDLNYGQVSKTFGWYNPEYDEVWFHYPSASSNEPDRVIVVCLQDFHWTIHKMDRTAAEYPTVKNKNPFLANIGDIYKHELGVNADDQPLAWTLSTNRRFYGKDNANINSVVPDDTVNSNILFNYTGHRYPQSANPIYDTTVTVTPTTEFITIANSARFQDYTWSGDALDQDFRMGTWFEEVQIGPPQ